jgi:transposase
MKETAMTKVSNKMTWFKKIQLTGSDKLYVGLDVHKKSIYVAIWLNGQLVLTFVMPAKVEKVVSMLERLRAGLKKVVYEAGPTGFSLARAIQKAGLPVRVVAPAQTPRSATADSKSDRLDCRKLAEYAAKDMLKFIGIPTEQEEADRQIVRLRDQLISKRRRVKQQIKSFLLQYGLEEPAGLTHWSLEALGILKSLTLLPELRFYLDMLLKELAHLDGQLKKVDQPLRRLAKAKRHAAEVTLLKSHPGVGSVTAMAFRMGVYQPGRFKRSQEVAKYLGLCPRVRQSGQKRREGPLIKTGRPELRSLLVEAAWAWMRNDPAGRAIYQRLLANTANPNKAIMGLARRLAVHLWKMLVTGEMYRPAA